jgi:hypothetical protein
MALLFRCPSNARRHFGGIFFRNVARVDQVQRRRFRPTLATNHVDGSGRDAGAT